MSLTKAVQSSLNNNPKSTVGEILFALRFEICDNFSGVCDKTKKETRYGRQNSLDVLLLQ